MKGGPSALSYWRSSPEPFKPACKSWARKFGRVDVSLLGFVFALFLLAAVALASYQSITGLLGRARWVEHTQQVRLQIEELLSLYSSVRIAWRSYLITGDGQQLQEFDAAEKTISSKIESLRRLSADNPRQQQRFASFFLLVTQDVAAIAESMALKKDGKLTDPADVFQQFTTVKLNPSELGKLAQQMKDEEDALLRNRSRESQRSADQTVFVIIFGNVVSFALLVLAFGLLWREVGQRTAAEKALIKSEQHFRSVAESASDAIISANSLGQIVFWNTAAQRIFGFGQEVLAQPLTLLMPERYREAHLKGFRRFLSGGDSHVIGKTLELSALRRDGTEFPMELSLAAWSINSQGDIFFTAIIRDITERKQAEDEIKALNAHLELRAAELEATNKELESFCYSISHDLRSPLRAINGYARILEDDYREKIDDQAGRLLKLISDNARKMDN